MSTKRDTIRAAIAAAKDALIAARPLPWDVAQRAELLAQYMKDAPTPARVALGQLLGAEDARERREAFTAKFEELKAAARAALPPRPWSPETARRLVENYRSMPTSLARSALGRVLREELSPPAP